MTKINADWIVGFVDGDGFFGFSKDEKRFYFGASQDKRSVSVLYAMKTFFQCGHVHKAGNNMREFKVCSKKHLIEKIIPFFKENPLQTSKQQSFEQLANKLEPSKVLDIKDKSKTFSLQEKALVAQKAKLTVDWLAGFIDAEGCFVCSIINQTIRPQFIIGLNQIDKPILDKIKTDFNYGVRYVRKNSVEVFQLSSNKDMSAFARNIILTKSFGDRLKTDKRIRARKWCQIVFLMQRKQHQTVQGFENIQKLYQIF